MVGFQILCSGSCSSLIQGFLKLADLLYGTPPIRAFTSVYLVTLGVTDF